MIPDTSQTASAEATGSARRASEYVRTLANFRTPVGSLEVFIFLATYFYVASIVLLVAMELDELVRADLQRPPSKRKLLPLALGVIRGGP